MLPFIAILAFAQNREDTLGKSNAQILALGRKRWYAFYTAKQGESTMAMAGAEGLYGDALAWRTDRLLKGRKSALRTHMRDFSNDAQAVGSAITGGGTMWNITAAGLYADTEEAFYAVLVHSRHAPKRVVSDVAKAMRPLQKSLSAVDDPKYRKEGDAVLTRLMADLKRVVADAKPLSRRDSDTVLEFCRSTVAGVADQADPK